MTTNEIIPEAAARNEWVKEAARERGFALAPDIFASGTALYESNEFSRKREEIAKRGRADKVLSDFADRVAAERRQDHDASVGGLRLLPTGGVSTDSGLFFPEPAAFRRLAGMTLPPGASTYLGACDPELRAHNANHWWSEGGWDAARGALKGDEVQEVKLRTREGEGGRRIWAVTSKGYKKFDVDQVARVIAEAVKAEARAEVTYDGYRATFDISWVTPITDSRLAGTGELFYAGVQLSTADDATERFRGRARIERGLCRNFMFTDLSEVLVGSLVHRGKKLTKEAVEELFNGAQDRIAPFVDKWVEAYRDEIADGDDDFRSKVKKLIERGHVKVAGVGPQMLYDGIVRAWEKEPMRTRAGLSCAISRFAHEGRWASAWQAHEAEEQATQLVHVRIPGLG